LDISGIVQAIAKCSHVVLSLVEGGVTDESDYRHRRLLRARRQRPGSSRPAAEQRDEIAPSHSITSSAATCRGRGTFMPSTFAVFRLMTSSNLVGCRTGKSAGLSPLRSAPA